MKKKPLFYNLLNNNLHFGSITLHLPDGIHYDFGSGEPHVDWHFTSLKALKRVAMDW